MNSRMLQQRVSAQGPDCTSIRNLKIDTKIVIEGNATLRYYAPTGDLTRSVKLGRDQATYVHTRSTEYHEVY